MSNRYCLGGLGNEELLAGLSGLVQRADELLSDLLAHLAEIDARRPYLELGFASLFAYCTQQLGMCESSAGRRILAARVCRKFPAAFARGAEFVGVVRDESASGFRERGGIGGAVQSA